MGLFSRTSISMDDLFVHTLQDIYYAEKQITKALPKMIEKATDPQLKQGLPDASGETRTRSSGSSRCSRCTARRRRASTARRSTASSRRPNDIAGDVDDKEVLDAALHRLRPGGRALRDHPLRHADRLGAQGSAGPDCAEVLEQTLDEEKATDAKLTQLAEARLNRKAA